MPTINTRDGTEIFYNDRGSGQPIVFSHGWPAWRKQGEQGSAYQMAAAGFFTREEEMRHA